MQFAGALDLDKLGLDLGEPFLDHAPVGFELRFAGPAEKAEAAALAFEMGPRAHQPAFLIGQMRVFDLQRAFARARAPAENLQNKAGPVDDLGAPGLFQIALLHRRQRAIHHHDAGFVRLDQSGDFLDLAFAEISRRPHRVEHHDAGLFDVEIDGAGKPYRLVKARVRRAIGKRRMCRRTPQRRFNDQCVASCRAVADPYPLPRRGGLRRQRSRVATARLQSDLFPGRRILGAFEQLDRMTGHNGRDGVLVDELRMTIATQQHAEIIEPGHHALQLDSVHQKNGERNFGLADVIEKSVLQVL